MLPDFLSDKWHKWMQEAQCTLQYIAQYILSSLTRAEIFLVIKSSLGQLNIPVTEFIPDKFINQTACLTQLKLLQVGSNTLSGLGVTGHNPLVSQSIILLCWNKGLVKALQIHQHKAGGIPQLVSKVSGSHNTIIDKSHIITRSVAGNQHKSQGISAILVNNLYWINTITQGFRHLPSLLISNQTMNVNSLEWNILAKFQSHHNHAGYPEENNIITSNQGAGWVELLQLRSFLWPAHSFKWPQARAEPGIQYILILMEMLAATFWTYIYISTRNSGFATIITVPGRNPMAPPQLAGNTPITNIVQPVAIDFGKSLWYEFDFASFNSLYSRLSQGIHLDKPLGRNHWLNGGMTTGAMTNSMLMILYRYQSTNLLQFLHQSLAALIAIHTLIFASTLSHFASIGNNFYLL